MKQIEEDTISQLSFSHDGKKVVFDRCREGECKIQVYDLATGELAAYQSPKNEQWTMGKYSYDGKRITFSVMPIKPEGGLDLGNMQIAVMDADGKNLKKVTTGPGAKLYPTFSHNGKKILYACAARIRESGKTPAANYDAWEVNLETGGQTQLTFIEYFYMSNLTYFPDDEQFIYYGGQPGVYEAMRSYPDEAAFRKRMFDLEFQEGKRIAGVVVMKGKELIPNPYKFPAQTFPQKPLLSKDGSTLIYEKSDSGKFYLYSPDGNHRLIGGGGSVNTAAISWDGNLLGVTYDKTINIYSVKDSNLKIQFYNRAASNMKNWDEDIRRFPRQQKMIPDQPSRIYNR
jgi:Tol biopolymer transport system component